MRDYLGTIVDIEECAKQTGRIMACVCDNLDDAIEQLSYNDIPHCLDWFIMGFEEKQSERCLMFVP